MLSACNGGSKPDSGAAAPTNLPSERVQLKLRSIDSFSNIIIDVEISPQGLSDTLAVPMASLASSILKFCKPNEGPVQGKFTLDKGRKDDSVSTNSPALARCYQRNLEDLKFPELPQVAHVMFRISGDGPLAPR